MMKIHIASHCITSHPGIGVSSTPPTEDENLRLVQFWICIPLVFVTTIGCSSRKMYENWHVKFYEGETAGQKDEHIWGCRMSYVSQVLACLPLFTIAIFASTIWPTREKKVQKVPTEEGELLLVIKHLSLLLSFLGTSLLHHRHHHQRRRKTPRRRRRSNQSVSQSISQSISHVVSKVPLLGRYCRPSISQSSSGDSRKEHPSCRRCRK